MSFDRFVVQGTASSVVERCFISLDGERNKAEIHPKEYIFSCHKVILNHTIKDSPFILHFLRKFFHIKAQVC